MLNLFGTILNQLHQKTCFLALKHPMFVDVKHQPRWIWRIRPHPHDLALETWHLWLWRSCFSCRPGCAVTRWMSGSVKGYGSSLSLHYTPVEVEHFHLSNCFFWDQIHFVKCWCRHLAGERNRWKNMNSFGCNFGKRYTLGWSLSLIFRTLPFTSLEPLRPCMRYGFLGGDLVAAISAWWKIWWM